MAMYSQYSNTPRSLQLSCQTFIQRAQRGTKGGMYCLNRSHQSSIADVAARFIKNQSQQQLPVDCLRSVAFSRRSVWNCSFKGSAHKHEDSIGLPSCCLIRLKGRVKSPTVSTCILRDCVSSCTCRFLFSNAQAMRLPCVGTSKLCCQLCQSLDQWKSGLRSLHPHKKAAKKMWQREVVQLVRKLVASQNPSCLIKRCKMLGPSCSQSWQVILGTSNWANGLEQMLRLGCQKFHV